MVDPGRFVRLTKYCKAKGAPYQALLDALRLDFRQTNQWAAILTDHLLPAGFYTGDHFGSLNSVLRLVSGIFFGYGGVAFVWPLLDHKDDGSLGICRSPLLSGR